MKYLNMVMLFIKIKNCEKVFTYRETDCHGKKKKTKVKTNMYISGNKKNNNKQTSVFKVIL